MYNKFLVTMLLGTILLPLCLLAKPFISVTDARLDQFIVTPGIHNKLVFELSSEMDNLKYKILDYNGAVVEEKQSLVKDKEAIVDFNHPAGYYTIQFEHSKDVFGIFSVPDIESGNKFFAIDAWLTGGKEWNEKSKRPALIRILRRCGISKVRDRIHWGWINPAQEKWDFNYPRRQYDTLAGEYYKNGISQMIACTFSPKWLGGGNHKYPTDIPGALKSWEHILEKMSFDWFALESWNEPDVIFSSYMPADQYMTFTKMLVAAMRNSHSKLPLVGGVFAHYNKAFLETAIENGLLECCDVVSFHTYDDAKRVSILTSKYRHTFHKYGVENVPLWISEAGLLYVGKTNIEEWQRRASVDVVRKAVEAKAAGIEKFFPFVYVYWANKGRITGLLLKNDTPSQIFAAYINARRLLGGTRFSGTLPPNILPLENKVFYGPGNKAVVVIFNNSPATIPQSLNGINISKALGIDGRLLHSQNDGILLRDGVAFVCVSKTQLSTIMKLDANANMEEEREARKRDSLKYDWNIIPAAMLDPTEFSPRTTGYLALNTEKDKILTVKVFNTADKETTIDAEFSAHLESSEKMFKRKFLQIKIPSLENHVFKWVLTKDIIAELAGSSSIELSLKSNDRKCLPLVMKVWFEIPLEKQLAKFKYNKKLPLGKLERWQKQASQKSSLKIDYTDNIWSMHARLPVKSGSWAFPKFSLSGNVGLDSADGMVLRLRNNAAGINNVLVMVWENNNVCYASPVSVAPPDGRWHIIYVPFCELVHNRSNAPDINEKLDLEQIKHVSIGIYGAKSEDNSVEVSDWYMVSQNRL